MTGLTAGAKLELVAKAKTTSVVKIALKLPDSSRLMDSFRNDTTLWKMLRHFETKGGPSGKTLNFTDRGVPQTSNGTAAGSGQLYYEMPVLRIMNREVSSLSDFQKTLDQLSLTGSQLIELSFKATDKTLSDAMQEISQFFKDEETAGAQEREPASKPPTVPAEVEAPPVLDSPATAPPTEAAASIAQGTTQQQPSQTESGEKEATEPVDSADLMDFDVDETPAAPHDPLKPVGIFSAPTNFTPAAASFEVPESAYTPTIAHAQAHQQKLLESAVNKRLKSDAELEAEARAEEAKVAAVKTVSVKVRFPDETSAEWVFGPDDTGATLYKAVRSVMANDSVPFKLVLPGPPTAANHIKDDVGEKHKLIRGYRMSRKVLVNFAWDASVPPALKKQPFLKSTFARQAKAVEVQDVPMVDDEPEAKVAPPSTNSKPQSSGDAGGSTKKIPKWLKGLGGKK